MVDPILRKVNEVSTRLARTPGNLGDLKSTLQHIAQTAQDTFATDACVILAFNPITSKFIGSHTTVENLQVQNEFLLHDRPRANGVTQQILKENVLFVEDLAQAPQYHNPFTLKEGIRSFAGLTMYSRHRQKPLGVIYLDFKEPRVFSSTDHEYFRIFATQAALLLQETWLEHHLEQVARIGQEINHHLATVEELFQELQTYVDNVLDESHTLTLGIYQLQTHTLNLYIRKQQQTYFRDIPLIGAYKQAIETQEVCFIQELSVENEAVRSAVFEITDGDQQPESLILVPLALRNISSGVLSIQHSLPKAYGPEDLFVLQLLANYISLALHNVRLYGNSIQLNETGQLLTQQLESEQTLQATAEKIREATKADMAILFPYEPVLQHFVLPPRIAGKLLDPTTYPQTTVLRPSDMAVIALNHTEPIFAKDSDTAYAELRGPIQEEQGNFKDREKIRSVAVVPLRVEAAVVGVLFVNFRQPQHFDSLQRLLIEGLAHYAAIAIKNSQVFGTLSRRRVRELEALQKIDRELNQALDLSTVLDTILKLAYERVPADEASILLLNKRTHMLETAAAIGLNADTNQKPKLLLHATRGITLWAVKEKKPILVNNVHKDPLWRDRYLSVIADSISELVVPLIDGDEVIGVLNVESTKEGAFQPEDQDILLTLAGQAVLAIKNSQAFEREKRLAEEGRVLNQISKEISSQLDPQRVFNLIVEKALELTSSTRGNLMIYDSDHNDLWMAAERGVTEELKWTRHSVDEGVVGHVARTRKMLNVDLSQPPWHNIHLDFFPGTLSELAIPMLVGSGLRGVLNVESLSLHNYSESDERLLQGLADLAVIALQNAEAFEREKRLVEEGLVLKEISRQITSQLDSTRVFHLILTKALELTHSPYGTLHFYNPETQDLYIVAQLGLPDGNIKLNQKLGEGIVGYSAAQRKLLNIPDVTQSPWNTTFIRFFQEARSELAVPLLAGDELRGVLNVENQTPQHFKKSDERLLQGLADLAVIALQNTEQYKKAQNDAQRFELLYQAGQELSEVTDVGQLDFAYDIVLRIAKEQSQSLVLLRRFDKDAQELELIRASQPEYAGLFLKTKLDVGINGQVARERRTIVIHDIENPPPDVAIPQPSAPETRSRLVTPILFEKQYYGNLGLNHEEVGHFQNADILFFEGLAQQLASTIHRLEIAQARKEFEQRALASEEMSSIGQSAFEVTHRLGNDLGLVEPYITDIRSELERLGVDSPYISRKLENVLQNIKSVLAFSVDLKEELAKLRTKEETAGEPVLLSPTILLEEAATFPVSQPAISIRLEVDDDVAHVLVFHNLVADILRNLIANSFQALPTGGTITLRAYNEDRSVALQVSDTGIGIPQDKLSKIFDLFFSMRGSSGFGLWSARRNALKNSGSLKVESQLGQGTTFTLLLPRADMRSSYEVL